MIAYVSSGNGRNDDDNWFPNGASGGGRQQKAAFRALHEGKLLTHGAESKRNDLQG